MYNILLIILILTTSGFVDVHAINSKQDEFIVVNPPDEMLKWKQLPPKTNREGCYIEMIIPPNQTEDKFDRMMVFEYAPIALAKNASFTSMMDDLYTTIKRSSRKFTWNTISKTENTICFECSYAELGGIFQHHVCKIIMTPTGIHTVYYLEIGKRMSPEKLQTMIEILNQAEIRSRSQLKDPDQL